MKKIKIYYAHTMSPLPSKVSSKNARRLQKLLGDKFDVTYAEQWETTTAFEVVSKVDLAAIRAARITIVDLSNFGDVYANSVLKHRGTNFEHGYARAMNKDVYIYKDRQLAHP